ncbi:MAG: glucosidase, partial [bacterium]|nr:glucosidase [bacterium]
MTPDSPKIPECSPPTAEHLRLAEDARRERNWKRWGPYLAERQWGTVREDYSPDGDSWNYFPFDHSRSRAYRWGEDGLLGICDRECRLCLAVALWNGRDPILKERLFGLTNPQGNHGEDVKECYYYLENLPTHAYMKALYKYPQAAFPYERLIDENARRGRGAPEFELADTGVFDGGRYFDVFAEYAKAGDQDILIRLTVINRGPDPADLHLLPMLWFRNTWTWGCRHEGCSRKPLLKALGADAVHAEHESLGLFRFEIEPAGGAAPPLLFTDNHTNTQRLFGAPNITPYVRDAFHDFVIGGRTDAVNPRRIGTRLTAHYVFRLGPGESRTVRLRLREAPPNGGDFSGEPFGGAFDQVFAQRVAETDEFYAAVTPPNLGDPERLLMRRAWAGLLWSRQFYHYIVEDWLDGDPAEPPPPASRREGRNHEWIHLYNRDVVAVPDKWEYPWYAAWDLAFEMVPFAVIDPHFAKGQLELFLREWYMHPNGQLPAYEFNLDDVNPPMHAWAAWRVYKITAPRGRRDVPFLERVFHKLLINFTWWV